jgi:hypothetical protein
LCCTKIGRECFRFQGLIFMDNQRGKVNLSSKYETLVLGVQHLKGGQEKEPEGIFTGINIVEVYGWDLFLFEERSHNEKQE